jgi:hypothetical protein
MKNAIGQLMTCVNAVLEKAKIRKGMFSVLAVFLILQIYFVRELLAAELIFGLGFAVLLVLGGIFYLVGTIGERGLDLAEAGIRVVADSARRGYSSLEEISRKPFRHPRSESAQ